MSTIKVLHVRDSHGVYGAERAILTLVKHLDRSRFDPILLCFQGTDGHADPLLSEAQKIGVTSEIVHVDRRLQLSAIRAIRQILKKHSISIVHAHDFKTTFYALLASLNLGVKRVATAHGSTRDSLLIRLYLYLDEHLIYRFFHKVVAVAAGISLALRNTLDPRKVVLIQNAVDLPPEPHQHRPPRPRTDSNGNAVFGVIGRLFPDKGHRFFLEAFQTVAALHPSVRALIVGGGPLRGQLEAHIRELNLQNRVSLCGVRQDMHNVYDELDFVVIPSLTEGLPYVLLEALARRIPVLATAVGDIPLLVEHHTTGFLVPPANARALVKYMLRFLAEPAEARRMADRACRRVAEHYSATRMARQTESLYESLLTG